MYGFFLDDERVVEDVTWLLLPDDVEWVCFARPEDMMFAVINTPLDAIGCYSFDHDLQSFKGGVEQTGYDVLKWLLGFYMDRKVKIPPTFFHTQNPVGKKNMESYLENYRMIIE